MIAIRSVLLLFAVASLMNFLSAQPARRRDVVPLQNWPAPLHWQPAAAHSRENVAHSEAPITSPHVTSGAILPNGPNVLGFVAMAPCRVVDTRAGSGFPAGFGAPSLVGGTVRTIRVFIGPCLIPYVAYVLSLNVAVIPYGPLGFLTVFP